MTKEITGTNLTSRLPLGDIIALLGEIIADISHMEEEMFTEGIDPEKKDELSLLIFEKNDMRRQIMREMGIVKEEMRCRIKHNIGIRQFASEVYYNLKTRFWKDLFERTEEHLAMVLSEALGMKITKCMRCLQDMYLELNQQDEEDMG